MTSAAYITWYHSRSSAQDFLRQVDELRAHGLRPEHPVTGLGTLLTVDGDDVPLPVERIAELVGFAVADSLNMQWWLDSATDVICRIQYEPASGESQTYYLDGLYPEQVRQVEELVLDLARAQPGQTEAVLVDLDGRTAEHDWWDPVIWYDKPSTGPMPDLLVVPTARLDTLRGLPPGVTTAPFADGLTALRREPTG